MNSSCYKSEDVREFHNHLSSAQIAKAEEFLNSGFLDSASWQDMRLVLSRDGRLIADKIVRELVL